LNQFIGKKILVNLWNTAFDLFLLVQKTGYTVFDFIITTIYSPPTIKSIDETIDRIIIDRCSVSRFGDGELKLLSGKDISFQKHTILLQDKLRNTLKSQEDQHLVCIPDVFAYNDAYTITYRKEWKRHLIKFRFNWYRSLDRNKEYFNAFISRCYLPFLDAAKSNLYFKKLKKIWDQRDVLIVEGEFSRLGVGNDLFDNAKTIKRILCPSKNAFEKYEEIFTHVKTFDKKILILLALGPTASVLAYDLHRAGYQAIDIGHIDVEYEWYLMGATKKEPIKNKFVNEVNGGVFEEDTISNLYFSQIIFNLSSIFTNKNMS
jgi:glycosyltransferase family protein